MLVLFFRRNPLLCVGLMIAANYFSAWVGYFLLSTILQPIDLDLCNLQQWFWAMVAISYLGTLLLEWPFVALCLRKVPGWLLKSIWGCFVVQSVSYLAIFGWYWAATQDSFLSNVAVVPLSEITVPEGWMLYYLSESDDNAYVSDLGTESPRMVCDLERAQPSDLLWLYATKSRTETDRYDLVAQCRSKEWGNLVTVLSGFTTATVPTPLDKSGMPEPHSLERLPRVEIPGSGKMGQSGWKCQSKPWDSHMLLENPEDGSVLGVSVETPLVWWYPSHAVQLPTGQVIFQLGWSQICILDPDARKVALIVKGHSPVVARRP